MGYAGTDLHAPLSYRVKVSSARGDQPLFGGKGVTAALNGTKLYLFVRNDDRGEPIELWKKTTTGTPAGKVADLAAGECFLVPIDNALVIYASCRTDTFVQCAVCSAS